jgi:nucleoside-diphosphate-sugar epimerase
MPDLIVEYKPDYRQAIADSWPMSLDDSAAREEWGWSPTFDLQAMVKDMLEILGTRYRRGEL